MPENLILIIVDRTYTDTEALIAIVLSTPGNKFYYSESD